MRTVNKSYKYRTYPNEEQKALLEYNIGSARFVFNHIKFTYEQYKQQADQYGSKPIYANRKLFNKILNNLKRAYPFLQEADSICLQKSYDNLIQRI